MKTCTKCGESKPLTEYSYKRPTGRKPGYQPRCKSCCLEDTRQWRQTKTPEQLRDMYLRRTYGITLQDYNELLIAQDCTCAICSKDLNFEDWSSDSPVVDHCHTTGHVRGILCNECNRGLGYFRDNVNALAKAISYLTKEEQTLGKETAHAIYD